MQFFFVLFFFQAEDGIRDHCVTGVQTCALPIWRQLRVPEPVVQELQGLKGLYDGFGARELARIVFHTTTHRLTGQTARRLWERLPPAPPPARPLLDYHSHPERTQARREVITLYAQGWSKRSISQFLQVS